MVVGGVVAAMLTVALTACTQRREPAALVVFTYDAFPEALETAAAEYLAGRGVALQLQRFQDTGGLFNQVLLARANPQSVQPDVVIGLDGTYLQRALADQLFAPYPPAERDRIDPRVILDPQFRLIPFDYGYITLNYNSEAITDPPTTLLELLDERFRDSIIMLNPATSSPGRSFLVYTVAALGEDAFEDFWRRLKPNILTVAGSWSDGYGLYAQGEAPIVVSYETSPLYHIEYEDDHRFANLILAEGAIAQVEFMGIIATTKKRTQAEVLIDFILSDTFQQLIPLNQFMYPVNQQTAVPRSFETIARPAGAVTVDPAVVDARFDDWLRRWEAVMR